MLAKTAGIFIHSVNGFRIWSLKNGSVTWTLEELVHSLVATPVEMQSAMPTTNACANLGALARSTENV